MSERSSRTVSPKPAVGRESSVFSLRRFASHSGLLRRNVALAFCLKCGSHEHQAATTGDARPPLSEDDRDQFVRDNQEAFNYGALEEFIGSDSQELFDCFQAL